MLRKTSWRGSMYVPIQVGYVASSAHGVGFLGRDAGYDSSKS